MTEACGLVVRHGFAPSTRAGWAWSGCRRRRGGQHRLAPGHRGQRVRPVGRERRALRLRDGSLVDCAGYDLLAEETPAPAVR